MAVKVSLLHNSQNMNTKFKANPKIKKKINSRLKILVSLNQILMKTVTI